MEGIDSFCNTRENGYSYVDEKLWILRTYYSVREKKLSQHKQMNNRATLMALQKLNMKPLMDIEMAGMGGRLTQG